MKNPIQKLLSLRIMIMAILQSHNDLFKDILDYFYNIKDRKVKDELHLVIQIKDRMNQNKKRIERNETEIQNMQTDLEERDLIDMLRNPDSLNHDPHGHMKDLGNAIADIIENPITFEDLHKIFGKEDEPLFSAEKRVAQTELLEMIEEHFGLHYYFLAPGNRMLFEFIPEPLIEEFMKVGKNFDPDFVIKYEEFKNQVYEEYKAFGYPIEFGGNPVKIKKEYKKQFKDFKKRFKKRYSVSLKKKFCEYLGLFDKRPFRCCEEELEVRGKARNIDLT